MHLRSHSTRLLILATVLTALAFNGDENSYSFSLSSQRIFTPGASDIGVELSGNGVGNADVQLRAYRITDPVEFFLRQRDPHNPTLLAPAPPNTFDMVSQGWNKVSRDARYAVRSVTPEETRRTVRDLTDLNGTRVARAKDSARRVATATSPAPDGVPKGAERYPVVASWQFRLRTEPNENWIYQTVPVPMKEKGVYLVEARIRNKRALTVLVVSEYGAVVKQSSTELVGFVLNTQTGQRVSDVPLTVNRGGNRIAEKTTGSDGTVRVELPQLPATTPSADGDEERDWVWEYRRRQTLMVGERDGNLVIVDPYYYYGYSSNGTPRKVYLHTDRPVYRPAQEVFYRGILRSVNTDGTYADPREGDSVIVTIETPRGDVARRDTLRTGDMGTFSNSLLLGDEAQLGTWSIAVSRPGGESEDWFNFQVEEYKKPEYKVTVSTDRPLYTRGDTITATARAEYYFGAPVSGARVEYFVYRTPYSRPWWSGSAWGYLYASSQDDDFSPYRMEMVGSGKGEIDAEGRFTVKYRTSDSADEDNLYRVQVNVIDNSRRSIAGVKSVQVTRGEFGVTTHTDRYVYSVGGQGSLDVQLRRFDPEGPMANIPFTVKMVRTWWEKRGKDSNGVDRYTEMSETVWTGSGTSGGDGRATVAFPVKQAGYLRLEVEARDSRGTTIRERDYLYAGDDTYANWYRGNDAGGVQIIPDKSAYSPGETMTALVIMPASNIDVMVSVEGPTLYNYSVERLNGTTAMVKVPVEERYAPGVYLSVTTIVNGEMYEETEQVAVIPRGKLLSIEINPDQAQYRPGGEGTVVVRARDEEGRPVANVDVALGVVDEAVYAIRPDATPDIQRSFYGNRWNMVETSSSMGFSFYGDARRIDPDAADALYGATTPRRPDPYGVGGKGRLAPGALRALSFGDVKGELFAQPAVRRQFRDVAFWTPSVRTDADGGARVKVNFPDNITTWRLTARAVGPGTSVGSGTARVIARKDLMVRMETPRFMIQGDRVAVATTVHNYLKSTKQTRLEFKAAGATSVSRDTTLTVPANGEASVDWTIEAPTTGTALLEVRALTDEESDAMELPVSVMPRGVRLATGGSAELGISDGSRSISLAMPAETDGRTATMTVTLAPSLAAAMLGSLDELIGYPYGCVEQTMSRFLPTIVVADVMKRMSLPIDSAKRVKIPRMVGAGLDRLYTMQHEDGGWGWWENDSTNPFMTAYVVYGLNVARRIGYDVDEERYARGREALETLAERAAGRVDATTEAYMLYALSTSKERPSKRAIERITKLSTLDTLKPYAQSLVALASSNVGMQRQAEATVAALERRAAREGENVYWPGRPSIYTWQEDGVEATASALNAIIQTRGVNETVRGGIRWLLNQRRGEAWGNTRQTAMVIYALVNTLQSSGEADPNYTVSVAVNGRSIGERRITREMLFAPQIELAVPADALRGGENTVTVTKSGTGRLYATARLGYFATGNALRPATAGFRVEREYGLLVREQQGERFIYRKRPFSGTVQSGDELLVTVRVTPERYSEYVMVEDPLPAGCEVIRETGGYTILGEPEYDEAARKRAGYGWLWWYADREVRDEKVAFFARDMAARTYTFSYIMRAQMPGAYSVLPTVASLMYYPDVRGNAGALALAVKE